MALREAIKAVIYQRLAVVAEEILAAAERVVAEYEKEDAFLKLRIEDQRRILELVLNADTGWWHHYTVADRSHHYYVHFSLTSFQSGSENTLDSFMDGENP